MKSLALSLVFLLLATPCFAHGPRRQTIRFVPVRQNVQFIAVPQQQFVPVQRQVFVPVQGFAAPSGGGCSQLFFGF
jgi:hypothetical protein